MNVEKEEEEEDQLSKLVSANMGRLLYLDIKLNKKERKNERKNGLNSYARMFQVEMLKKRDSKKKKEEDIVVSK